MNHGKPELSLADSPPFIRLVRLVNLPSPFVITKLHFGFSPCQSYFPLFPAFKPRGLN